MKGLFVTFFAVNIALLWAGPTWAGYMPGMDFRANLEVAIAEDWGQTGHRITGAIAERYLSRKARKRVSQLLGGQSLAQASTYADEIKSDRSFSRYSNWHYVNYPLDSTYALSEKSEYGDIVRGSEYCISVLRNPGSTREEKEFHLKLLVHFIGDLHQPMHAGRSEDRGGNDIQVRWFNRGSNLHRVWDSDMIESYGMSFSELAEELLRTSTRQQREAAMAGSIVDWVEESHVLAKKVYASVEKGEKLSYRYSYDYKEVMFERLRLAGWRLAYVLNEVFDN